MRSAPTPRESSLGAGWQECLRHVGKEVTGQHRHLGSRLYHLWLLKNGRRGACLDKLKHVLPQRVPYALGQQIRKAILVEESVEVGVELAFGVQDNRGGQTVHGEQARQAVFKIYRTLPLHPLYECLHRRSIGVGIDGQEHYRRIVAEAILDLLI